MPRSKGTPRKNGQRRKSTTGRVKNAVANQSNWRRKLQTSRLKFDDPAKQVYLQHYRETGLKEHSALQAGVSYKTVQNHRENDPDFAEAEAEAFTAYSASIAGEVRRRGRDGWDEAVFNKGVRVIEPILNEDGSQATNEDGAPLFRYSNVRKFDSGLLILEAKRVIPEYREKQTIDLTTNPGVLVAPADMSPEDWVDTVTSDAADKPKPGGPVLEHQPKK